MTVTPTSYEAIFAANLANHVASSATLQALVGAANAAAALAYIIDSWGGTPDRNTGLQDTATAMSGAKLPTTAPFVVLKPDPMESELVGIATFNRSGTVDIAIYQQRTIGTEAPPDSMQRWRNVHGGIRADIEALFGTSGCLATGEVSGEAPVFLSDVGVDQQVIFSVLKLKWWG